MTNQLFYGDNLQVLREHIADQSVDLITADNPSRDMEKRAAAVGSFEDDWGRTSPRLQIITLGEVFQAKEPDIPFVDPSSLKKAKREDVSAGKQEKLL